MRYILNGKMYDTEKSQKIITYIKSIENKGITTTYPKYRHTIYKTRNGAFFTHIGKYVGSAFIGFKDMDCIQLTNEDEVKEILELLNKIDIYEKLFGKAEEG